MRAHDRRPWEAMGRAEPNLDVPNVGKNGPWSGGDRKVWLQTPLAATDTLRRQWCETGR
jgi:hypothetical protein